MAVRVWRRPFEWAGDTKWHEFLYDAQAIFKIIAAISFVAVLLFSFNSWKGTLFCGVVFLASAGLWLSSALLELRARQGLSGPTTEGEYLRARAEQEGVEPDEERAASRRAARAGTKLGLEILAVLLLVAVACAVLLFSHATLGIGIGLAFLWLLLFGAPYWAAAVLERESDEKERNAR